MTHDGNHTPASHVGRITRMLGCDVRNTRRESIGQVEDLIIDRDHGRVAYAILSFGGFLGIGGRFFAIPFGNVLRTSDPNYVIADVSKAQLEHAPTFAADSWPMFDRTYGAKVHDFYQASPYWDAPSHAIRGKPTPIGRDALDPLLLGARGMLRASDAIGTKVEDPSGAELGDIDEMIIEEASGRIVYAVLSFGGFLGMGDKLFAIPWQMLTQSLKDDDRLVLDVAKARLESAPGFDKENWPDVADRRWGADIHEYYGQEPYWNAASGAPENAPVRSSRDAAAHHP